MTKLDVVVAVTGCVLLFIGAMNLAVDRVDSAIFYAINGWGMVWMARNGAAA